MGNNLKLGYTKIRTQLVPILRFTGHLWKFYTECALNISSLGNNGNEKLLIRSVYIVPQIPMKANTHSLHLEVVHSQASWFNTLKHLI